MAMLEGKEPDLDEKKRKVFEEKMARLRKIAEEAKPPEGEKAQGR
jgi:hypothetical protein